MTAPKVLFKEYEIFGNYVRDGREAMGLSQAELASLMDLSEGSIRHIEHGRQGVYLRTALQLSCALGFSLSSIQTEIPKKDAQELKEKIFELKRIRLDKKIDEVKALNKEFEEIKKALE